MFCWYLTDISNIPLDISYAILFTIFLSNINGLVHQIANHCFLNLENFLEYSFKLSSEFMFNSFWNPHEFPMKFLWTSFVLEEILKNFLWISYEVLTQFLCSSCAVFKTSYVFFFKVHIFFEITAARAVTCSGSGTHRSLRKGMITCALFAKGMWRVMWRQGK